MIIRYSSPLATKRIKAATSIVTLISHYLNLKKTGKSYTGLCPFHREKTPSFTVDSTKRIWKCYGCGAWGDCFDFVRRIEGTDFMGAKRRLAETAGISLDDDKQEAQAWAAEWRAIEADLPAARLWRRTALALGEALLDRLKEGLWDPQAPMQPFVGEVAEWTTRIAKWRALDAAELVPEYRRWRVRNPEFTGAMARAAAKWERADRRGFDGWRDALLQALEAGS